MSISKLFSICIPTFNRAELLKKCILSFLNDAIKFEIPIYISDNNSKDNTEEIVKDLKRIYKNIFYYKQPKNVGIDLNMLHVVEMTDTKYALWLGDDDILLENAIPKILDCLQENPDLCVLNISNKFKLKDNYNSVYDFFGDYGMIGYKVNMQFSTLIVDVEAVKNSVNKERFIGTLHLYAGVILDYLTEKYLEQNSINVKFIKSIIVGINASDKKTWSKQFFKTYIVYIPKWFDLLNDNLKHNDIVINAYKDFLLVLNNNLLLKLNSYKLIKLLECINVSINIIKANIFEFICECFSNYIKIKKWSKNVNKR